MERERRRKIEGYLTVEVSLLLPFVIGVIVYVIYFQFFWYNRCLMDQETAATLVRMVQAGSGGMTTLKEEVQQWRREFLTDRYIGWETEKPIMTSEGNSLFIQSRGRLKMPNTDWDTEIVYKAGNIDTSLYLRQCRKIILQTEGKK